jgi:hypothetical protein
MKLYLKQLFTSEIITYEIILKQLFTSEIITYEIILKQLFTYEIILKQLFTSAGSVIIVNKNLDFVSVLIHR